MHQLPAALLTWLLPCLVTSIAVGLYYVISDFPNAHKLICFSKHRKGSETCIAFVLFWSGVESFGRSVEDGHLLYCHQWVLLGALLLQVMISESHTRSFFFPPALPASLSASSRKCLALCRVGWLCTSNLSIPSYVLSKRWMRSRECEQNYTWVYIYTFVELASGEDEGLGKSETSWMPPGFFSHCVISFQPCLGPLSSPGCVHR